MTRTKYRGKVLQRLGLTSQHQLNSHASPVRRPVIWVHALSVGEVTSALPLIRGLRQRYPDSILYFSTTTTTGHAIAQQLTNDLVDALLFSPFDFYFSVERVIRKLKPQLFILVETDFWPCWLHCLKKHRISTMLVNGRVSTKSLSLYIRFRFLFHPMFACFSLLSVQSVQDVVSMQRIGIPKEKIVQLGNLKFDSSMPQHSAYKQQVSKTTLGFPDDSTLWICGSTHRGEEEMIFSAYRTIIDRYPGLCLVIAPRNINRIPDIETMAQDYGVKTSRRSMMDGKSSPVLLLDTMGELASSYQAADIAFIGGSLVPEGGHNPLEAATFGVPSLFGPNMDDFADISRDLVAAGGAIIVSGSDELSTRISTLLSSSELSKKMGRAAMDFVLKNQGVVECHIHAIENLLRLAPSYDNG